MRTGLQRFAILSCIGALSGCATHQAVDRTEREAVLATLDSWNEGWRVRDAALAVADYADDTDWTNAGAPNCSRA